MILSVAQFICAADRGLVMLLELYGQNFGCFRDEFRLSMLATDVDPGSDRGIIEVAVEDDDEPLRLLRAVAIYGANASGKSTVLRAASILRQLMSRQLRSDAPIRPYEPFAAESHDKVPVRLGVKAVVDSRLYDYEVRFDRARFVSERLGQLKPDGKTTVLFCREGQSVAGEWKQNEQFTLLSRDFRPNALLLSLADRLAPALAKNIAAAIRRLLTLFRALPDDLAPPWESQHSDIARRAGSDPLFGQWLLKQLRSADLGVVDLRSEESTVRVATGPDEVEVETFHRLLLMHRGPDGSFPIPYSRESNGTRRLVQMAPMLFDLTHQDEPHAVFVDEIDASLHPALLQGVIQHFNCEIPVAQASGQLIFVTHDTSLLDAEAKNAVLRRDQIYLTEKDASGAARLYSVAEFKERNNLNLRRRYLQGRYGALPSLGSFAE